MAVIIGTLVFALILWILVRNLPETPAPQSEEELKSQGYSPKEAKQEARAQRAEVRADRRMRSSALHTASRVGSFAKRITKDLTK